jgi:cytochrome bd ubiquinol oxidase subunit II
MTAATLVAVVLLIGVAAYSCGGGTDYGAGLWDLAAGGVERGSHPRALIDYAMAPVWEVNNVWLVFVLVVTWTGFPRVFAAVFSAAWIPLTLAILGLVLRGVGFAFRKQTRHRTGRRHFTALFGLTSILTPFFFAAALGAVASGRVPLGSRDSTIMTSWLNPTSLAFGFVSLAATAFIAAVFLTGDAGRYGAPDLVAYFRRRTLVATGGLLVIGGGALAVVWFDARYLFAGLWSGWALLFTLGTPVLAVLTAVLVHRGIPRIPRVTAVGAVGATVFAWGLAQHPYILPTSLTIAQAAAPRASLNWLVIVIAGAVVLVIPPLVLLYRLDAMGHLEADHDEDLSPRA